MLETPLSKHLVSIGRGHRKSYNHFKQADLITCSCPQHGAGEEDGAMKEAKLGGSL